MLVLSAATPDKQRARTHHCVYYAVEPQSRISLKVRRLLLSERLMRLPLPHHANMQCQAHPNPSRIMIGAGCHCYYVYRLLSVRGAQLYATDHKRRKCAAYKLSFERSSG